VRLACDLRDDPARSRHRGEDRSAAGKQATRNGIGGVVVRADESRAAMNGAERGRQPRIVEVGVPANDHGVGTPLPHGLDPPRPQRLVDARSCAYEGARAWFEQPRRRLGRREQVGRHRRNPEALELGEIVTDTRRRVVGEEEHALARSAQSSDGIHRAHDGTVRQPHDAIEVEYPRHVRPAPSRGATGALRKSSKPSALPRARARSR
jgi:hypothetical protein